MKLSKEINWGPVLFLTIYQILLLGYLPFYFYYSSPAFATLVLCAVLLYATGLSITGGYHRYYAHRSFKTNPVIEAILLFLGSLTAQGSALRWAFDHRIHHAFVDTDKDPYSIQKGFWYAHFLWIIDKPKDIQEKVVSDLIKNPLVMFQHRHYLACMIFTNLSVFLLAGWALSDYLGALVLVVGLRMFLLHHFTWFINSLAHTWGDRPFCQEQTAVNNFIIALLTFGEGYHNYHHTFANDYRNGIRWYHFDPTKWLIWTLEKCGLVHSLKRVDAITIKKRLVMERKNLLVERIKETWDEKKVDLEQTIEELSNRIVEKIAQFDHLKSQYKELKKACRERDLLQEVKNELRTLKKSIKEDWKSWYALSNQIMKLQTT